MATTPYSPRSAKSRPQRPASLTRNVAHVASVAAAAYGTYLIASWAYEKWWLPSQKDSSDKERRPGPSTPRELRRAERIAEWCRIESDRAFSELLPALRKAVESKTDSSEAARDLKRLRSGVSSQSGPKTCNGKLESTLKNQEKELWEAIKNGVLARMMCTCYAHTLLLLLLRVELFVLGRRLLFHHSNRESFDKGTAGEDEVEPGQKIEFFALQSYEFVLQHTLDRFLKETVPRLVDKVTAAVNEVMGHWDVTHEFFMELTSNELQSGIMKARSIIEATTKEDDDSQTGVLSGFIVQTDSSLPTDLRDELAGHIIEETWDILESPAWDSALQDALNVSFGALSGDGGNHSQGLDSIFSEQTDSPSKALPLASIIAHARNVTNTNFYFQQGRFPNPIVPMVLQLRSVEDLTNTSFCSQQ